jgi:hypothetical protein
MRQAQVLMDKLADGKSSTILQAIDPAESFFRSGLE